MIKKFTLLILLTIILFAENINQNLLNEEQRKIYLEQQKVNSIKKNTIIDKKLLNLKNVLKNNNCIYIRKINIIGVKLFNKARFNTLIEEYVNKCNTINELSNLKDKISNIYIDEGYITSRAYIKPQNLSNGIIDIHIMEGKINKILAKNINISNLYKPSKEKNLNLKDLEIVIQQAERLKSQSLNLKLIPAKEKIGYSDIQIENLKNDNTFYGNISSNNFGNKKTGKYQISANFNYENLFNINDIATVSINSTDNIFQSNDNNLGNSISYSFPLYKFLFKINFNHFRYKQLNKDEFNNLFQSNGETNSFALDLNYKLFYSKQHTLDIESSFSHKKTKNSLNNTNLEIQTYDLSVLNLGLKHSYLSNTYDYYSKISLSKGLKILGEKNSFANHKADFLKYILDLQFNKYFKNNFKYNLALRAQYSNDYLFGTEEISMGGPYSVRGFKNTGLVGNSGFYTRNEISYIFNLNNIKFIPYIGIDYGYVKEDKNNIFGDIVGSVLGNKFMYKKLFIDIFYTIPIKNNDYTKNDSDNFFGINFSYNY